MAEILQGSTYVRQFQMDATGRTPAVNLSKAGGAFAVAAGVAEEISNKWYKITLTNVDTNTPGGLAYHITSAGADVDFDDEVVAQSQLTALNVGATASYSPTRNALIAQAYRKVRAISAGQQLSGFQLTEGIEALNLIVRELDEEGSQVWAYGSSPFSLTLQEHIGVYTTSENLPSNIIEIVKATSRSGEGRDTPLTVGTVKSYESIEDKFCTGAPEFIYLNRHRDPASQSLYVWPLPSNVGTQSEVLGTDALNYRCVRSHAADSTNRPITGANWRLYWELGGSSGVTWVTGTAYTAPKMVRLWYKRPLADFTAANDNPDLPVGQSRTLMLRLAKDLSFDTGKTREFRQDLNTEIRDGEARIFRKSKKEHTTNVHNKTKFY